MTGLMIIAAVVVAMAVAMGSKKFLGSSTSMLFGNKNLNAGAAC